MKCNFKCKLRNNIRCEISTISGQDLRRVNKSSAVVVGAFGLKGNIFSICCSPSEFLLGFLKVITIANLLAYPAEV